MNALHTFLTGLAAGMDIIADCHGLTQRALIEAGCPDTTATRLLALADTYFGPTAFSRLQRESIAAARTSARACGEQRTPAQLRADAITLYRDASGDPDRVEATGTVYFVTPTQSMRGDRAVYSIDAGEVVVTSSRIDRDALAVRS